MKRMINHAVLLGILLATAAMHSQNSLLWKISGKGITAPSYLYGTIHLTCDATLDEKTIAAVKETKQLYLELDMDDPSLQASMMTGMMMQEGKTLSGMLSEADFKIVNAYLTSKLGFPGTMLNTIKPYFITAMFMQTLLGCEAKSIEDELMKISKSENAEVFGLETLQQQSLFDEIPYQDQADELLKSVKDDFKNDKTELQKMYTLYSKKDLDALYALIKDSDNTMASQHEEKLLTDRNKNWVPKIISIAKVNPTFFGVGAGHLAGANGVIALLKKEGFSVTPVQ